MKIGKMALMILVHYPVLALSSPVDPPISLDAGKIQMLVPGYKKLPETQKEMSFPYAHPPKLVLTDAYYSAFVAVSSFPAEAPSAAELLPEIRKRLSGVVPSLEWLSGGVTNFSGREWAYAEIKTQSLTGPVTTALLATIYEGAAFALAMSTSSELFENRSPEFLNIAKSVRISEK